MAVPRGLWQRTEENPTGPCGLPEAVIVHSGLAMTLDRNVLMSCVAQGLGGLGMSIFDLKADGVGMPQRRLRQEERAFLARSLDHLAEWLDPEVWDDALAGACSGIRSRSRGMTDSHQNLLRVLGLRTRLGKLLASDVDGSAARYLLAQGFSLDARYWRSPMDALFFAACQQAAHEAMRSVFGDTETQYTKAFLTIMPEVVRSKVVKPLQGLASVLPEDFHLQFATVSMEGGKGGRDIQGADLAIVIGTMLYERPVWKVVLLQAKAEKSQGRSDVGHNEGAQLAEILSTGMGGYLFYPIVKRENVFIPTVRLAEHVFADAYGIRGEASLTDIDPCGTDGSAWDFASFVALEMRRSNATHPGRVFPTAQAVADALSLDRKRPLGVKPPQGLLIASTTPVLHVQEFRPLVGPEYTRRDTFGLPPPVDLTPSP